MLFHTGGISEYKIKEVSSNEFPKGVLHSLSKIDYNI